MEFCNILDDFFLLQNNLHVTRDTSNPGSHGNILDLVLTSDEFLVDDVLVHPNAFDSDHHPLTFKLYVKKTRPRNAQRKVYCYRSGDFNGLRETLRTLPWDLVTSDTSIDTSLDKFQDMLFCAIHHHISQRTLKRRSRPPWIDNEIMKLIRKKKKLWKRLKTNGSADLFLKLRILEGRPRSLLIQAINSIFSLCLENSRKIPSIFGHSILSNLRQNEFLKLLSMETPGLET